jgi:hypothetical protein
MERFMTHYKGRISLTEAMNLPMRMYHGFYYRLYKQQSTEEGQKQIQAETIQDMVGTIAGV